jgi:hypothetical protein
MVGFLIGSMVGFVGAFVPIGLLVGARVLGFVGAFVGAMVEHCCCAIALLDFLTNILFLLPVLTKVPVLFWRGDASNAFVKAELKKEEASATSGAPEGSDKFACEQS